MQTYFQTQFSVPQFSGVMSQVSRLVLEVAQKTGEVTKVALQELWNISCQVASLLAQWAAIGFTYAKQWSIIGFAYAKQGAIISWEYLSAFSAKAFQVAVYATKIGFAHLKTFLITYHTEVTFTGIGVVSTLVLMHLVNSLSAKYAPPKKKWLFF